MAELNPPLGATTPEIFLENVKRVERLVNGPAATVPDRGGDPLDSWRLIMAKVADVLAAYQENGGVLAFADEQTLLAYTPDKPNVLALDSATGAYWFWDGTAWTRNRYQFGDIAEGIQRLLLANHTLTVAMNEMDNGNVILREIIQQQHVSQQLLSCAVNEVSGLPDTVPVMQLDALMTISTPGGALAALDGFDPGKETGPETSNVFSTIFTACPCWAEHWCRWMVSILMRFLLRPAKRTASSTRSRSRAILLNYLSRRHPVFRPLKARANITPPPLLILMVKY